ncbi:AraC family transcriptional regulator [Streptomyces sp. NPDC048636]|uniref:AraC family transcriptional regulator n=1 Tax=Streptomyces sp. NPDC048636 TaxID=3155762 RepID=UPI00341B9E0A
MCEASETDSGTWGALDVSKQTLPTGTHALRFSAPTGVRVTALLSGVSRIRGDEEPEGQERTFLTGEVCTTPPGLERGLVCTISGGATATLASVTVPLDIINGFLEDGAPQDARRLRHLDSLAEADPVLATMVSAIVSAHESGADDLYARSAAQFAAAHLLARTPVREGKQPSALNPHQLTAIETYMRENLANPITLDDLCALTSYSRFHFVRYFKAVTGHTPYRYLIELRIDTARKHLESGDDSIATVSQRCGFQSTEHFSRTFRRIVGYPPSQYRSMRG